MPGLDLVPTNDLVNQADQILPLTMSANLLVLAVGFVTEPPPNVAGLLESAAAVVELEPHPILASGKHQMKNICNIPQIDCCHTRVESSTTTVTGVIKLVAL